MRICWIYGQKFIWMIDTCKRSDVTRYSFSHGKENRDFIKFHALLQVLHKRFKAGSEFKGNTQRRSLIRGLYQFPAQNRGQISQSFKKFCLLWHRKLSATTFFPIREYSTAFQGVQIGAFMDVIVFKYPFISLVRQLHKSDVF